MPDNFNGFDIKARHWDKNLMHIERSNAIALKLLEMVPLSTSWQALEYGSGTGLLSFNLHNKLGSIILMDSSVGMTTVANEKIEKEGIANIKAIQFDIEHQNYEGSFDIIYNQMVMHHVENIEGILKKFYDLLKQHGYLAIADLYSEDGSFHSSNDFNGHKGFDIDKLKQLVEKQGFQSVYHETCYTINKVFEDGSTKSFPLFLLVAHK